MQKIFNLEGLFQSYYKVPGIASNMYTIDLGTKALVISPSNRLDESQVEYFRTKEEILILAPSGFHFMGIPTFQNAFDKCKVYASAKTSRRIGDKIKVSCEPLSSLKQELEGFNVEIFQPEHTKIGETWVYYVEGNLRVCIVCDAIFNWKKLPPNPFMKLISLIMDNAPGLKISRLYRVFGISRQDGYLNSVVKSLKELGPNAFCMSHGDPFLLDDNRDLQSMIALFESKHR